MKTFKLAVILLALGAIFTEADTYYVDRNHSAASDGNAGTSIRPWKTIQHAVDVVSAGDTVVIRGGTYPERVQLPGSSGWQGDSGSASAGHITYTGADGETVILDGTSFSWGAAFLSGVNTEGDRAMNYIRLRNLTIRNYPSHGLEFSNHNGSKTGGVGSHHIIIENVTVHDCKGEGILVQGGDRNVGGESYAIEIRNCSVYHNGHHGIKFTGDDAHVLNRLQIRDSIIEECVSYNNGWDSLGTADGIGIHVSTGNAGITVRNNTCYGNRKSGFSGYEIFDSIYEGNRAYGNGTEGTSGSRNGMEFYGCRNMIVRANRVHNNPGNGIVMTAEQSSSQDSVINNIVYANGENGIRLSSMGGVRVLHNTAAGNQASGLDAANADSGNVFKGNVLYQNGIQVRPGSGNTFDFNLYYPNTSFSGKGSNALSGDPLFEDAASGDYRPGASSPALDAVTDLGVTVDATGRGRPTGSGYEIGAYEMESTVPTAKPTPPDNLRIME